MNAVNWIKRRVSLPASVSPLLPSLAPNEESQHHSLRSSNATGQQQSGNELGATMGGAPSQLPRLNSAPRNTNSAHGTTGQNVMPHDSFDSSSPLSILAATSKLTTFPYGELQALNARMNIGSTKPNSVNLNVFNGTHGVNGVRSMENGDVGLAIGKSAPKQRSRTTRERNTSTKLPAVSKNLLPSALLAPIPAIPGPDIDTIKLAAPDDSPSPALRKPVNQRNASTSVLLRSRSAPILHKKSASLSSTQNTRSSKRLKTSHPIPLSPITPSPPKAMPPPSKSKAAPAAAASTAESTTTEAEPTGKKRVLPVRQGHIDILDGEISLLSTPQRLDNRPTFETSHKVILVDDTLPSTPTTRYEPFSSSTIPDPNTSPNAVRPRTIPAAHVTIRPLNTVHASNIDPLPDSLYLKAHRRHEFTEIRLRNREREKIDYESSILERQLTILKSEEWRKIVAPAAAEREGLKDGEEWDWEGRRERRIELLDGVLKRVRTWREAEIKMRKGLLDKNLDIVEEPLKFTGKRRRQYSNDVEEGSETTVKRRRGESTSVSDTGDIEAVEEKRKKKGGRRGGPIAFGEKIPKAGLRNREFQIPLEWVPEDKRV